MLTALVTIPLWEDIQGKLEEDEHSQRDFKASKGWFELFKNQRSLHALKVIGEATGYDHPAVENYQHELKKWIEERATQASKS